MDSSRSPHAVLSYGIIFQTTLNHAEILDLVISNLPLIHDRNNKIANAECVDRKSTFSDVFFFFFFLSVTMSLSVYV